MAIGTGNNNPLYSFDFEKETARWNGFLNAVNGPKPKTEHTTRQSIWKKNKATLWHYPAVEKKYEVPIFIIYSLFNQATILDLAPGSSMLERSVNSGYDVYLLDWGIAGYEDKEINIEDYIEDYIKKGVRRALRHSGAEEVTVLGYCLGGTIAAMYASIAEEPIKNLVVAAVPIDFSVAAMPETWAEGLKDGRLNLDRFIDVNGIMSSENVEAMFRMTTSPVYYGPYVTLLSRSYDTRFVEKWRRMNTWTSGHVPLTGGAFRQLMKDLFQDNKLVKGEFTIHGKQVDLKNIHTNLLVVSSSNDKLIPEEQSLPLMDLVSSQDKTYQLVESGHVSLAMSGKLNQILDNWLPERSQEIGKANKKINK
ncbi:alpha/beta fold hydrolase [Neobacillus sp. FSL H8-0543]|uniref:alpha/beta fold hydrolase n=1 Tax=Neobacillus sp. FSL H8-0543 TaxID=2954672 RepID=UPI0031596B2A